jgi:hypothetical protein
LEKELAAKTAELEKIQKFILEAGGETYMSLKQSLDQAKA